MTHAKLVSFTGAGAGTLERISNLLSDFHIERYERTVDLSLFGTSLPRFTQQAMADCDLIVFVGAAGIAVRAVAPYLSGKAFDPAVVVVDEAGKFVIPILSGHLGGANGFAKRVAEGLGAQAVITTATDLRGKFAVDSWAEGHRCKVYNTENIRNISGALLRGEKAGLTSAFPVKGQLPENVSLEAGLEAGILIGYDLDSMPYTHTLNLIPQIVHLGIGCRKGVSEGQVEAAVRNALERAGIPFEALCAAATISLKSGEPGLLLFCKKHGLEFHVFAPAELNELRGGFTESDFVKKTAGVGNVCERAAVLSSKCGRLICRKASFEGVTVAFAEERWRIEF